MEFNDELRKFSDPIGNWYKSLSDYEISELDRIKISYQRELDDYSEMERIELYEEIESHVNVAAQIIELENIDNYIRIYLDYNREYEKVLDPNSKNINDEHFKEFAYAFKVLDNEDRGMRILKNIARRRLIKYIIKELKRPQLNFVRVKYPKVFPNSNSEEFFFKVLDQDWMELRRGFVSQLYRFLKGKQGRTDRDIFIKCNDKGFADFWNGLDYGLKIKIYKKSAGMAPGDTEHTAYEQTKLLYDRYLKSLK